MIASDTLTTSEERLLSENLLQASRVMPVAQALKIAGYEFSIILDIFSRIKHLPSLPPHFSIVNNRYLALPGHSVYDLVECVEVDDPDDKKLMALTFWI